MRFILACVFAAGAIASQAAVPHKAPDAMRPAELRNVRLLGEQAKKFNRFVQCRMMSEHAQKDVFGEARSAFETRDDDSRRDVDGKRVGGLWRGEFWGKLMMGTARVADYLQNEDLLRFVREECARMISLEDEDGYLGSYTDKELVDVKDKTATCRVYGWNTNWNLWNRKYAIWGMFMAYLATGDKAILASVERQLDQWIGMMHRLGLPLRACGQPEKVGLPPMSVLKPLLMVYTCTGKEQYLEYAREMLPDWDREDGACPNFFRNADSAKPIASWYPRPSRWAKTYELLSCLDGLLEYHRVTGDKRALETVKSIRENIWKNEQNLLGGVGYCDQLNHTVRRNNVISEVCDAIHWIRLNLDLYFITGDKRYLDTVETCYINNFLAGVNRSGDWTAFAVRGHGSHCQQRQCGYAYNHCCVNNVPRTYMDMASAIVTADANGTFHVNFYQDATVEMDGTKFEISGNYPVENRVRVKISGKKPKKVEFRRPDWCPKMDVAETADGYELVFDIRARLIERDLPKDEEALDRSNWIYIRYLVDGLEKETIKNSFLDEPRAAVMWGPVLLARSRRTGATEKDLLNAETVNLKGYGVKATPVRANGTWGAWELEFTKENAPSIKTKACDYQSAGDDPFHGANAFSIWF